MPRPEAVKVYFQLFIGRLLRRRLHNDVAPWGRVAVPVSADIGFKKCNKKHGLEFLLVGLRGIFQIWVVTRSLCLLSIALSRYTWLGNGLAGSDQPGVVKPVL
jgi:hypothetical protein